MKKIVGLCLGLGLGVLTAIFALPNSLFAGNGTNNSMAEVRTTITVGHHLVACPWEGDSDKKCLNVLFTGKTYYEAILNDIEGFSFHAGNTYILEVAKKGSGYRLVREISRIFDPMTCEGGSYSDGCNECQMTNGVSACTKRACIREGIPSCSEPKVIVGGDEDIYGCKASAGYSRDGITEQCVRVWEVLADRELLVDWAHEAGLTSFDNAKDFRFDDKISRQEAAKVFVVAMQKLFLKVADDKVSCELGYKDFDSIDNGLSLYVTNACKFGMMKGMIINNARYFAPMSNLTRAQALAMSMRILYNLNDSSYGRRYDTYLNHAKEHNHLSWNADADIEAKITRGEVITLFYKIYMDMSNL